MNQQNKICLVWSTFSIMERLPLHHESTGAEPSTCWSVGHSRQGQPRILNQFKKTSNIIVCTINIKIILFRHHSWPHIINKSYASRTSQSFCVLAHNPEPPLKQRHLVICGHGIGAIETATLIKNTCRLQYKSFLSTSQISKHRRHVRVIIKQNTTTQIQQRWPLKIFSSIELIGTWKVLWLRWNVVSEYFGESFSSKTFWLAQRVVENWIQARINQINTVTKYFINPTSKP